MGCHWCQNKQIEKHAHLSSSGIADETLQKYVAVHVKVLIEILIFGGSVFKWETIGEVWFGVVWVGCSLREMNQINHNALLCKYSRNLNGRLLDNL